MESLHGRGGRSVSRTGQGDEVRGKGSGISGSKYHQVRRIGRRSNFFLEVTSLPVNAAPILG